MRIRVVDKRFNLNQRRDRLGRWTLGGGGSVSGGAVNIVNTGAKPGLQALTFTGDRPDNARAKKAKALVDGGMNTLNGLGIDSPDEIVLGSPYTLGDSLRTGLKLGASFGITGGVLGSQLGLNAGLVGAAGGTIAGFALGVAGQEFEKRSFVAAYEARSEKMYMNTLNSFWDDIEKEQAKAYEDGIWSSPDPQHVIYHEMAHKLQFDDIGIEGVLDFLPYLTAKEDKTIREKVSAYGASEPAEMVAEVFAGTVAGQKYDQDVLDIYKKYQGPPLPTVKQAAKIRAFVKKGMVRIYV